MTARPQPKVRRVQQVITTDAIEVVYAGEDLTLDMVRRFVIETKALPAAAVVRADFDEHQVRLAAEARELADAPGGKS